MVPRTKLSVGVKSSPVRPGNAADESTIAFRGLTNQSRDTSDFTFVSRLDLQRELPDNPQTSLRWLCRGRAR